MVDDIEIKTMASNVINSEFKKIVHNNKSIILETWRIKVDGQFITTHSGKTVWKKLNHAKSALKMHFEKTRHRFISTYYNSLGSWAGVEEIFEEQYQKFLTEHVEFVKLG